MSLEKYKGVIPAFYACYDENGDEIPADQRAVKMKELVGEDNYYISADQAFVKIMETTEN